MVRREAGRDGFQEGDKVPASSYGLTRPIADVGELRGESGVFNK